MIVKHWWLTVKQILVVELKQPKKETPFTKKKKEEDFSGENAETVLSKTQREKAERVQARQRRIT